MVLAGKKLCVFHWSTIPKKNNSSSSSSLEEKEGKFLSDLGHKMPASGFLKVSLQFFRFKVTNIIGINIASIFLIKWKLKLYSRNSILNILGPNLTWVINAGLEMWHFWWLHCRVITVNLFYGTVWSYLYMEILVHIKLFSGKCIFGIAH